MSIVCCKIYKTKIEIASDSISVKGRTQYKSDHKNKYSKLSKVKDMVVGSVGSSEDGFMFQVFCQTHTPKSANEDDILAFVSEFNSWRKQQQGKKEGYDAEHILIFKGRAFYIENYLVEEIHRHEAIGAGADFALSALYLDHTVEEAAESACELSIYCEKPIKKLVVKRGKK